MEVCMVCIISGKVQGVYFRASAKKIAVQLNITGWAKNLSNGNVEIFACGKTSHLESFYDWLQEGPDGAIVQNCCREMVDWQKQEGFLVK